MIVNDSKKVPKGSKYFECAQCDYFTSRKSQYIRHTLTDKHNSTVNDSKQAVNDSKKVPKGSTYECICGKSYKYDTGLYRHKSNCDFKIVTNTTSINQETLIMNLIKQNNELHTKVVGLLETGTHNTTTNSHNKTFNLHFFLNETCKDAMNITDFVNNIQLQLPDLEKLGEVGYVNGISNIIVKNLKDMDITSRPIHCTDSKREVMYIKDEDKWDKEPKGNPKVRNAIKNITHKNSKLLNEFKEKNPDYNNSSSKVSDKYNKLLIETMGGKGDNDAEKENKIIKNITKEILVEKEILLP
jgi:hypothetical protein